MRFGNPLGKLDALATAGLALVKVGERNGTTQSFISAFEIDVVVARHIPLGITNQPISGIQVKNASWGGDVRRFFDLNCIHDNRLDRSIDHTSS